MQKIKLNPMFKANNTTQNIKLRNEANYTNINAKTVRFQKSAIPYMTRHLNNKHQEKLEILSKLTKAK